MQERYQEGVREFLKSAQFYVQPMDSTHSSDGLILRTSARDTIWLEIPGCISPLQSVSKKRAVDDVPFCSASNLPLIGRNLFTLRLHDGKFRISEFPFYIKKKVSFHYYYNLPFFKSRSAKKLSFVWRTSFSCLLWNKNNVIFLRSVLDTDNCLIALASNNSTKPCFSSQIYQEKKHWQHLCCLCGSKNCHFMSSYLSLD